MTWKNRNWHGTDASNEISLFEYGFIMRWRPKRQDFQVVHLHGFDKEGRGLYMFGYFDYTEELKDLKDERLKEICSMCGMTEEQYMECLSPAGLANDLVHLHGLEDTSVVFMVYPIQRRKSARDLGEPCLADAIPLPQ